MENDSPSFMTAGGVEYFAANNKKHRKYGPAVVYHHMNGHSEWWWEGEQYSFEEFVKVAGWTDSEIVEYKLKNDFT